LDLAAGIVGIVLAVNAKREGFTAGLQKAGFVVSIIGTIAAAWFTLSTLLGMGMLYDVWDWIYAAGIPGLF